MTKLEQIEKLKEQLFETNVYSLEYVELLDKIINAKEIFGDKAIQLIVSELKIDEYLPSDVSKESPDLNP